jgi:hypothetical protein
MSYHKPRIKITMSFAEVVKALSRTDDGGYNPGAVSVLTQIVAYASQIDPDDCFGPLGPMMGLDNLDCYGSRIWMLYKDVCGQNTHAMLGVLRAVQLGFTTDWEVNAAIDRKTTLDIPALLAQVKERLPNFMIEPAKEVTSQ